MIAPHRFDVYTVPGAAQAFGVPLDALERAIEANAVEVFRAAGARCVRAAEVEALAKELQGGGNDE